MPEYKLGRLVEPGSVAGVRDAFHVGCVLVRSNVAIQPGQKVRFVNDLFQEVVPAGSLAAHAIADPFVSAFGPPGTCLFWVILMPDTTRNLAHHFDLNISDVAIGPRPYTPPPEDEDDEDDEDDDDDYDDSCRGCN